MFLWDEGLSAKATTFSCSGFVQTNSRKMIEAYLDFLKSKGWALDTQRDSEAYTVIVTNKGHDTLEVLTRNWNLVLNEGDEDNE